MLENKDMEIASKEILRQGTVLVWAAFEILCRDFIAKRINLIPELSILLANDPRTANIFQLRKLEITKLAEHDFNMSKKMGNLFTENVDFSNLMLIKNIFDVIYPDNQELRETLSDLVLWKLNQDRHCIIHNRGIIDSSYINKTGSSQTPDTELIITPEELEDSFIISRDTACNILKASNDISSNS